MAKLEKLDFEDNGELPHCANHMFYCPGCKMQHGVWVSPNKNDLGASWGFNGDFDNPTITPSILAKYKNENGDQVCHSFVTDGKIQFLGDCTHELAGQTVEMIDVE